MTSQSAVRLGVDIGGTFTDVALELGERRYTAKGLTTQRAPEEGVLAILRTIVGEAGIQPADVNLIIHGTTLATNALIERKGAKTALLTTEGFRDVVEIRHENRFEQYDVNIDLPPPLVPRRLRLPIRERVDAQGDVLIAIDEASIARAIDALEAQKVEAVAVGLLHSFTNPDHERRVGAAVVRRMPQVAVTLSSDVSPEMREYERFSTACANAYLQPLMGSYVTRLERGLAQAGFRCPLLLMTSGGGITTTDTAVRFPVRLVESGPAGGAIFAACIARQQASIRSSRSTWAAPPPRFASSTTARPQTARAFEVARIYRFQQRQRPAAAYPGDRDGRDRCRRRLDRPRRYARPHHMSGQTARARNPDPSATAEAAREPTVTDADVMLGRIDPAAFSGGRMPLDGAAAKNAIAEHIGTRLDLSSRARRARHQ